MGNNHIAFDDIIVGDNAGKTGSECYMTPPVMEMALDQKLPTSPRSEDDVSNYKNMLIGLLSNK